MGTSLGAITRGCGKRVKGGIYLEVATSPNGMPLEFFLCDPVLPVDPTSWGISPTGVHLIERDGVTHVVDWIGAEHYPNVADFLEEGRRFGFSRRIQRGADFAAIGPGSGIMFVHARAFIENAGDYYFPYPIGETPWPCPQPERNPNHRALHYDALNEPCCAGIWWQDVYDGIDAPSYVLTSDAQRDRQCSRPMPSFTYHAHRRPDGVTPRYRPGLFCVLPLSGIAVVNDPEAGTHESALEAASKSGFSVTLEDE